MSIDFELAKKYAADKLLKQALKYLEKDPEENFLQILDIGEKLAKRDNHKNAIKIIKEKYKTTPLIKKYLKKINNIAPSYKNGLLMNFFVNSAIFGIPYQYELSEDLGVDVPWTMLIDPTSA